MIAENPKFLIKGYHITLLVILMALTYCAPERNTTFSKTYHNTTAKYNAWFVANEDIKAIEADLLATQEWNYNKILPIFPQFDTTKSNSYQDQIDHCIEKASLAVQYHKGSNWEDNAYLLVGKARFYGSDFDNAIVTFKYVNTNGEGTDERHEALVNLMRTYIEYDEMRNAISVADHLLKEEKLSNDNKRDLFLTRAYYYQKTEELDRVAADLVVAEPLINNRKERSRINFILGQLYQELGNESESYARYKMALKNNPPYELEFYTKLNMGSVTALTETKSLKKVRKYFVKLLKDRKNEEYKDKIYYDFAKFEVRQGNLDTGIDHYKSSVKSSISNDRQKSLSYLALGQIYYDSLAKYRKAKAYYDSTISFMPKDEDNYELIVKRHEVLSNFVAQWTIIHDNDSLLNLVSLDKDSLDVILTAHIAEQEAIENARRKEERRQKRLAAVNNTVLAEDPVNTTVGASNFDGTTWYFYSPNLLSKGVNDFQSKWGDRPLEDFWRLKSKAPINISEEEEENDEDTNDTKDESPDQAGVEATDTKSEEPSNDKEPTEKKDKAGEEFKMDLSEVMASLPTTPEQQQQLLDEIEEASFQLANIYYFELKETDNAIETFEGLLTRFPDTSYRIEVMYQLYLIYSKLEDSDNVNKYKNLVLTEAPKSIYAKLIKNPRFREDSEFENVQLQLTYKDAYSHYKAGNYDQANVLLDEGLAKYKDNEFIDNTVLLKALIAGKTKPRYIYESRLRNFVMKFPESDAVPYANSLINASQDYQINSINSSRAKYTRQTSSPYYYAVVFTDQPALEDSITSTLRKHVNDDQEVGVVKLDKTNTIALITNFAREADAKTFDSRFSARNLKQEMGLTDKSHNFVISQANLDWLYATKELDTYLEFYSKNYQLP